MNESILTALHGLQRRQLEHDKNFHQDIFYCLSIHGRLSHLTLHFSKYLGCLSRLERSKQYAERSRLVADSLIINLSLANTLNVNLQNSVDPDFNTSCTPHANRDWLLNYAEIVGSMAKACESIDHVENFPSRSILESSSIDMIYLLVGLANDSRIDLAREVHKRWTMVESKSVLFSSSQQVTDLPRTYPAQIKP